MPSPDNVIVERSVTLLTANVMLFASWVMADAIAPFRAVTSADIAFDVWVNTELSPFCLFVTSADMAFAFWVIREDNSFSVPAALLTSDIKPSSVAWSLIVSVSFC